MMKEQDIRELKNLKLNYIEEKNKEISATLNKVDDMREEIKQVEQEILMINRILGDAKEKATEMMNKAIETEAENEYYLHSREGNSFHFRRTDKEQGVFNSFTVTHAVDGTVCMTGDMGDLVWQRNYYPDGKHDYGFPYPDTELGYFAEKLVNAFDIHVIMEFSQEQFEKEVRGHFEDDEEPPTEEIDEFLKRGFEDYGNDAILCGSMAYEALTDEFSEEDWADCGDIGLVYKPEFRHRFELLQQVSGMIREAVKDE